MPPAYNRYIRTNHSCYVPRQEWRPCYFVNGPNGASESGEGQAIVTNPEPSSTPVMGVASPASFLATGFQLKRSCIPVRVLRRVHASPRTAWQMDGDY